jgi:hypothetical protein
MVISKVKIFKHVNHFFADEPSLFGLQTIRNVKLNISLDFTIAVFNFIRRDFIFSNRKPKVS